MAAPQTGPCRPWATFEQASSCGACSDSTEEDFVRGSGEDQIDLLLAASQILYQLAGQRFSGECDELVRPPNLSWYIDRPLLSRVQLPEWSPWGKYPGHSCCCGETPGHSDIGCAALPVTHLGYYPIKSIESVWIDGVVLDPSAYRVDDYTYLVRQDGQSWPCCQDPTAGLADLGSWFVQFTFGEDPPQSGKLAAAVLACELVKSCEGDDTSCRLPRRAVQASRQGLSMLLLDPTQLLEEGRVGIFEIDSFIAAYNPSHLVREPAILSPDLPASTKTTWSASS